MFTYVHKPELQSWCSQLNKFHHRGASHPRRAVEQCSCHSHPRDSSGSKAPKPPKPPSNVNPGLINPKRLFDWGGTIWVLDYHYLGSTH